MKVNKMSTEMLMSLKNQISVELRKRPDGLRKLAEEKVKERQEMLVKSRKLLNFIDKELGFKLSDKLRTPQVSSLRFSLTLYLRNNGMSLQEIGKLLRRNHATIINGLQVAKGHIKTSDSIFMPQHEKINALIERFNTQNS